MDRSEVAINYFEHACSTGDIFTGAIIEYIEWIRRLKNRNHKAKFKYNLEEMN